MQHTSVIKHQEHGAHGYNDYLAIIVINEGATLMGAEAVFVRRAVKTFPFMATPKQ